MIIKLLSSICILYTAVCVADKEKLQIRVSQHLPCVRKGDQPEWPILLPSMKEAPVVPDTETGNCYRLTGKVKVSRPVRGKLFSYVEVKNGTAAQPAECRNAKPDGCGGFGSCVFCDLCNSFQKVNSTDVKVELKKGGKFDCGKGFEPGMYDDTSLKFCMPSLDDFLKAMNIDRTTWDQFASDGRSAQTAFMVFYLFENDQINKLPKDKLRKKIKDMDGVIGCHKLVMDVYSVKSKRK